METRATRRLARLEARKMAKPKLGLKTLATGSALAVVLVAVPAIAIAQTGAMYISAKNAHQKPTATYCNCERCSEKVRQLELQVVRDLCTRKMLKELPDIRGTLAERVSWVNEQRADIQLHDKRSPAAGCHGDQ